MTEPTKLNQNHWAVICTIHQEPDYTFLGSELRIAKKMVELQLLEPHTGNKFKVTSYGERCYRADQLLPAVNP